MEWITPVLLVAATVVVAALGARKVAKALRAEKAEKAEKAASDTESDAAPEDEP